jgi:hypothetical protein
MYLQVLRACSVSYSHATLQWIDRNVGESQVTVQHKPRV